MSVVADASAVIAALDDRHVHHQRAVAWFAEQEAWLIHPVTLAEVLVYPASAGRKVAEAVMFDLIEVGLTVRQPAIDPLALAELRASTRLKMPDCLVLALAIEETAFEVLTFDDRLASAAAKALPTV